MQLLLFRKRKVLKVINLFPDENKKLVVGIIGSARLTQEDLRWKQASDLGRTLAVQGYLVMTGGYGGLMAASAQGAVEAGGLTIGLPMSKWTHLTPDESHSQLIWSENYFERLQQLLTADYLIVLDGGIGTLSELALAWAIGQTEETYTKVIILGEGIKRMIDNFRDSLVISDSDLEMIKIASSVEAVIAHIAASGGANHVRGGARG